MFSRVVLHSDVVKWCCGSTVLPYRGGSALWNCALCCCMKSGVVTQC